MSNQTTVNYGPTPGSGATAAGQGPDPSAAKATGAGRDWPVEVTDRLGSLVRAVRDKTTLPITKVARLVVFGLVAAFVAVVAVVLVIVALVRVIDVYLPFDPYARRVWVGYAGLGAIFLLAGAFCWSKRSRKPQETHS
jgi:hypothetical protein